MTFPARDLLNNWDRQQSAYIAQREERFTAALDVLAMTFGDDFHVVDVACGPGSFSLRLLNRFPKARVTAIDLDPLLLHLAQEALHEHKDRIRFIHADIALPTCFDAVEGQPQAMVSSTAIHWLLPEQQTALYRNIYHRLNESGLFINADHQRFDNRNPRQKRLAQMHDELTQEQGWTTGAQDWDTWFEAAIRHPELEAKRQQRQAIFADRPMPLPTPIEFQLAILRQAGFTETGTVWQFLDDYVVAGWK